MIIVSAEKKNKDDLKELSGKERIDLVQGNFVRGWWQRTFAFVLIRTAISYLTFYTVFAADEEFKLSLAQDMRVLVIMGVGSALAMFGLGRTVGRR